MEPTPKIEVTQDKAGFWTAAATVREHTYTVTAHDRDHSIKSLKDLVWSQEGMPVEE